MSLHRMVILYNTDEDTCQVQGPIKNRGLAYAILERAKEEIHLFHRRAETGEQQRRIIPVPGGRVLNPGDNGG